MTRRLLYVLLVGAAGCGSTTEPASRETTEPEDIRVARAFEREVLELCGLTPNDNSLNAQLEHWIRENQVTFDRTNARACVDWLQTNACAHGEGDGGLGALVIRLPGICRTVYEGNLELGAHCARDEQCFGDAYCHFLDDDGNAECTRRVAPGERCFGFNTCAVDSMEVPSCVVETAGNARCAAQD